LPRAAIGALALPVSMQVATLVMPSANAAGLGLVRTQRSVRCTVRPRRSAWTVSAA
jgi:hypothetical protein